MLCLIKKNTQKGGVNWVFLNLFKHNKFKHNINKNKEIELKNLNSDFIVVQHFLAYVHSPQSPNWVRVPLTWSFNQASNLFTNVFRTGPVIEPEKLPVHGSLVEPVVEPRSNRWCHKYIIYILLKLKIILKNLYNIKIIAFHFFVCDISIKW